MYRMILYRGFEIHVELTSFAQDLYKVSQLPDKGRRASRHPRRPWWPYSVAQRSLHPALGISRSGNSGAGCNRRTAWGPAGDQPPV